MEIKDLLSSEELSLITDFMKIYSSFDSMPAEKYLTHWLAAKSQWLLPIFGNKLRISFPVSYSSLVNEEMQKILYSSENCVLMDSIRETLKPLLRQALPERQQWEITTLISYLFNFDALCANALSYDMPVNEKIKLSRGEKPFRALNSLIKRLALAVPPQTLADIETLRLAHSQALNKKKVSGKLVLSIHPFDYFTMSENNYDWTSCMNWSANGCYHAGTLEMLNSPSVLVAYLEGDKPFYPINDSRTWANKKWRELFILDHDFITGIKGYPYQNDSLEEIILNKLADIAEAIFPPYDRSPHLLTPEGNMLIDNKEYPFETNLMYNDFENNGEEKIFYSTNITLENFDTYSYVYSAPAYCTVCGGELYENEESTLCDDCNSAIYCICCGERIEDGEGYLVNDEYYCTDCADENFNYCDICNEYTPNEVTTIYELVRDSQGKIRCWEHNKVCENCLGIYETNGNVAYDERVNKYFWVRGNRWDRDEYINPLTFSDEEIKEFL